jgi:hypothetical protein
MKFKRKRIIIIVVLLLIPLAFAVAQLFDPSTTSLAHYVPGGALVYAETGNLKDLLSWWNKSDVNQNWGNSRSFEQFQNSRLFLKLKDRIEAIGAAGSFQFTLENLSSLPGTRSALALYNIGDLKAIAITEISLPEAEASQLWLKKSNFTKKTAGDAEYYLEPKGGALCFSYFRPYLIIASDEDLLKSTLLSLQGSSDLQSLDQSDPWKRCQELKPEAGDIELFLDQKSLNANRYFQRYWLYQNVSDFEQIQAVWINLRLTKGAVEEQRYFVMDNNEGAGSEQDVKAYLAAFEQIHHEYIALETSPDSKAIANQVLEFVNRLSSKYKKTSYPPDYSAAYERALQAENLSVFSQQIDEPILRPASESLMQANQADQLSEILKTAKPLTQIKLAYPLWDDRALFVQFPETMIVQLGEFEGLDQKQFLNTVREYFTILFSTHGQEITWISGPNGEYILQSWNRIYVRFQKPWILISNREGDFHQTLGILPSNAVAPMGNYREADWKNGRWKYSRLMRRLDYGSYHGEEPLFFSENLDSLLYALEPVQKSSVLRLGSKETVRYETN